MEDRKCENCIHAKPYGGENDNRCDAWECEYINRKEAIEAYKARRNDTEWEWCHDCKEYDQNATEKGKTMSIILKGIDLPEDGETIVLKIKGSKIYREYPRHKFQPTRIKDAEAIQIPKGHGRLIDRSVLFEEYQNLCNGLLCRDCPFFKENSCSIEEWILNQPPILEAEE